ncbi:hypothetical protein [Amycolatopsis sp. NPDC051128]|uniref:hypothetical protein n=1 Tax=Amycolatopsis sp. NPDC051128 TaxID=3155412 RepID=UPI003441979A
MDDQPALERGRGPLGDAVRGLLSQSTSDRLDPAELPTILFAPVTAEVAAPPPTTMDWDPPSKTKEFLMGYLVV